MSGEHGDAAEAVERLLNASSWDGRREVISTRWKDLSDPAADEVFADLLRQYKGDDVAVSWIRNMRLLLDDCLEYGVSRVFSKARPKFDETTLRLVERLLGAKYDDASKLVAAQSALLLGDEAFEILDFMSRIYRDDDALVARVVERRQILQACRDIGIDEAFAPYVLTVSKDVGEAVVALLQARTVEETASILMSREVELTSENADAFLGFMAENATSGPPELARIPMLRALLARCRSDGCVAVARELLQPGNRG